MNKIFDSHFHLLFKHYISSGFELDELVEMKGFAELLNEISGGVFGSQIAPAQIKDSNFKLGVCAILAVEHAFARRILHIANLDLSKTLPLNRELMDDTKAGNVTYYDEFLKQVKFYTDNKQFLQSFCNITFLNRRNFHGKKKDEIKKALSESTDRQIVFSIEGGHNLSDVSVHGDKLSLYPDLNLKKILDNLDLDFISLNLCHLSYIPEQHLGCFAQGLNKQAQKIFDSEDFTPQSGLGISELGKKVIRQALTHERPMLIDIKHMGLYSRMHYYNIRARLIEEVPQTARLPLISSHTGFTFISSQDYIRDKAYKTFSETSTGKELTYIKPENRKIGHTEGAINTGLFANPWTINLFDDEIVQIMESGGMIGLSLDQRILGAANIAIDSARSKYYEREYIAGQEWQKLYVEGILPGAEEKLFGEIAPGRPERHVMLLCMHIIHAVKLGYANLNWLPGKSPWDHLCIGSDFDGLINPLNGLDDVKKMSSLPELLEQYLPQAEMRLTFNREINALKYDDDGNVDLDHLKQMINKFLYLNGEDFIARFLCNWN